jgi:hypothetical protein
MSQYMLNECYYCCLCKRQVLCMNIQQSIYIYRSTYFTSLVLCNEIAIHMVHFICTVYRMDLYVPTPVHISQHMLNECYYCCLCKRQVLCMNIQQSIYIYRSTYFTSLVLCNEIAIHMVHYICTVYQMDPICTNMHAMSPYMLN